MLNSVSMRKKTASIIKYTFLTLYAIAVLFPLLIVILPTFQTVQESSRGIFTPPSQLNFNNYIEAWERSNFPTAFKNSLILSGGSLLLTVVFGGLAAFPIGLRPRSKVMHTSFLVFLVGLMLPFQSIMIPLYVMMSRTLKLTNTYIGPIAVYVAMTIPLSVFFYTQFIRSMSKELEEAAVTDGCGYFRMYWQIYFPLLKPVTSAIVIQNMLVLWNDLLVPLLLIDQKGMKPIMPMVYMFFGTYYSKWNLAFSVLLLAAIPMLLLFLLLQKQFIHGISAGGVKG